MAHQKEDSVAILAFPTTLAHAAVVGALVFFLAGPLPATDEKRAREVVGHLGDEPVYAAHVLPYIRPELLRIGVEPVPDPRQRAFDAAVATRLLSREAQRRGIAAPPGAAPEIAEAFLVRELIKDELGSRPLAGDLDEETLRTFFEDHRERLLSLASARVSAIVVDDEKLAERLLREAGGASDAEFQELSAEHSLDEPSRAQGGYLVETDKHGSGLEPTLARVATRLRYDGAVGLARGFSGRFVVLRVSEVRLEERPWDDEMASRVKNLFLRQQHDEALESLIEQLRQGVEIVVDERALAKLPVPAWGETHLQEL